MVRRRSRRRSRRKRPALFGPQVIGRLARLGVAGILLLGMTATGKTLWEQREDALPWVRAIQARLPWGAQASGEEARHPTTTGSAAVATWQPGPALNSPARTGGFDPSGRSFAAPDTPRAVYAASPSAPAAASRITARAPLAVDRTAAVGTPHKSIVARTATVPTPATPGQYLIVDGSNPGVEGTYAGSTYTVPAGGDAYNTVYDGYNSAGTITQSSGTLTISQSLYLGANAGSNGIYTLSGGSLSTGAAIVGLGGAGTFTQSGGSFTTNGNPLILGDQAGSHGTYTLGGGTLTTIQVTGAAGTNTFNFNGGTLQASGSNSSFTYALQTVNVQAGGAIIDSNGFNVTVAQNLSHDPALGSTTDGGLTKNGAGTLTLAGANSYTGPTTINGGTLAIAGSASVGGDNGSNGIFFNGTSTLLATATATLAQDLTFRTDSTATSVFTTATLAASPGVTLTLQPGFITLHSNTQLIFGEAGDTGTVVLNDPYGFGTQGGAQTLTVAAGTLRAGGNYGVPFLTSLAYPTTVLAGATLDYNGYDASTMTFTPILANLQGAGTLLTGGNSATNITIGQGSFSGVIAGPGQITKTTPDALTLSGASTYAGGTTVSAGTLLVNNPTGSGTGSGGVSVGAGGVLGGHGAISGSVTVASSGTLVPGPGVARLSTGSLNLEPGSTLLVALDPADAGSAGTNAQLDVTGTVLLEGSNLELSLSSVPTLGEHFAILLNDGGDAITGVFAQGTTVSSIFDGNTYLFSIDYSANDDGGTVGNDISLITVSVPEPATWVLLLAALGVLGMKARHRLAAASAR